MVAPKFGVFAFQRACLGLVALRFPKFGVLVDASLLFGKPAVLFVVSDVSGACVVADAG